MARSRKKPIIKDRGLRTHEYWRPIRSRWKQHLKKNWDDPDLAFENPKTIINDWDYCDYIFRIEEGKGYYYVTTAEDVKKATRK